MKYHLNSEDPALRDYAVRSAGKYRVREIVPELLSLLEKKDILGSEAYYKIPIVKALGQIGDERAVPELLRLYKSRSLFYRRYLDELKLEIFRGLPSYPVSSIKAFISEGAKSKNEEINNISQNLLKQLKDKGGKDV